MTSQKNCYNFYRETPEDPKSRAFYKYLRTNSYMNKPWWVTVCSIETVFTWTPSLLPLQSYRNTKQPRARFFLNLHHHLVTATTSSGVVGHDRQDVTVERLHLSEVTVKLDVLTPEPLVLLQQLSRQTTVSGRRRRRHGLIFTWTWRRHNRFRCPGRDNFRTRRRNSCLRR